MFKVPEWGDDIPKNDDNFVKSLRNNKRKKKKRAKPTQNVSPANNFRKSKLNGHVMMSNNYKTKLFKPKNKGHNAKKVENKLNKKRRKQTKHLKRTQADVEKVKKHVEKSDEIEIDKHDIEKPDETLLKAQKEKLNDRFHNDDREELLFTNQEMSEAVETSETVKPVNNKKFKPIKTPIVKKAIENTKQSVQKLNKKKSVIKALLSDYSHRNHINVSGDKLRERMLERLKAAQFRYLNEKLYTSSGSEAQALFKSDPDAFRTYHQGYQQQVKKWPVNPLDIVVEKIMKMPKTYLIADMGCGEAALARRVPHAVRSFDLVAASEAVVACDMAHTPLLSQSVDVAVYCLALMGTDLARYLVEANRVLKVGGHLLIAEVESRFEDVEAFAALVQRLGFRLKRLDRDRQVFHFMHFVKVQPAPVRRAKLPEITLKPCLYKRR